MPVHFHFMTTSIIQTEDGSHSLFNETLGESYHSVHGAIGESKHIFIEAGLNHHAKHQLHILEIGFGTGLNAFLTLLEAEKHNYQIQYTTLELYPVDPISISHLNYPELLSPGKTSTFYEMHNSPWNKEVQISPVFNLKKIQADFTTWQSEKTYDLIYFDAFSPEKQPEMWSESIFTELYKHCNHGAVLTTYCAKGIVRRALQTAGFIVERLPGPPGKREILRGSRKS